MASSNNQQVLEDEIRHFKSIPWCLKHLDRPGTDLIISAAPGRTPKPSRADTDTEDSLFAITINSPSTISHFILFYPRPATPRTVLPELKALITLGSNLDGYSGICHGGIVATIFDEVLGYAAPATRVMRMEEKELPSGTTAPSYYVTAYLNTTYLRPVRTPGTILVVARTVRTQGRKVLVEAYMEDEEGEKLAKGEALFVQAKLKL
jgi:acyl-coenzyme A thioesterase PaaI-like protein